MKKQDEWIARFREDSRRSGIFLDLDGTLSEAAPGKDETVLHPRAADILPGLAQRYPMCVMSGRRASDVASLVGLPHVHYVGAHGMEWVEDEPRLDPMVLPYLPALERARKGLLDALAGMEGVAVEDRLLTVSLRFSQEPGTEDPALQVAEGLAVRLGLKVRRGMNTLELGPPVDIDKGTVLIRLGAAWKLRRALYAGGDLTSVDAFRGLRYLMKEGGFEGIAVAVHSDEVPIELEAVADLTVEGPGGLLDLLERL